MITRHSIVLTVLLFAFTISAQEIQYDAIAINIEVPVRVYKGKTFIDNLTIDDFEVFEEGVLQEIEAVYFIKKTHIERAEKPKAEQTVTAPELTRHFLFLFEIIDYLPQIKEALDEFFLNIILPGDTLLVVTPIKTYSLEDEAFSKLPRDKMAETLSKIIRKDVISGNADYNSLIKELSSPLTPNPMMILRQLRDYKRFDEQGLLQTAEYLESLEGQKHIFLFYQKEGIPIPRDMEIAARFELIKNVTFDEDRIREAFSDSSISVHFLYITKVNSKALDIADLKSMRGREILDQSSPIFGAFTKMAQVTGGISESSANIAWSFNQAVQASENYYLLYYSPKDYKADGEFKKIAVKVKGQNYRVTHRSGYVAD